MEVEIIEKVENISLIRLPIEDFESLPLSEKLLSYNLWHAGVSGDEIIYQQLYRHGLEIRNFFLDILEYKNDIPLNIYDKLELFAKKILINKGIHNTSSGKKFSPPFTKEELYSVINMVEEKGFNHKISSDLERALFDPDYDVMIAQKTPPTGEDILTASSNTFYPGIKLSDMQGFEEKNPLNSTVVKENGKLVEKVWRSGNDSVPPGIYSSELKNVNKHLTQAISVAPEPQKKSLELLKQFFEEGHDSLFDDYNIEWVHTNPEVDTILGFIEQYRDTRGSKGSFESMVFFKDHKMNHIIKTIAENSQHFEDNSPWIQNYKKKWGKIPVANAVMLLSGFGNAGPVCWAGVNLPNAQSIREKHGSKNIYISNITYASRTAFSKEAFAEFIEKKEDADMIKNASNVRGPILVTLHEVVGHGSGQMSKDLKGDPKNHLREFYSSLEEARAELCSLHHVWDPKLMELGLVKSEEEAKGAYLGYVFQYLTIHRRFAGEEHIHEDHERATALIVEYCIDKGSAGFYKKNGKTYPEVKDYQLMRTHVAELLSEIMRIKAEGDYTAGKNLVTKYGININPELRDEVVSRAQKIGYPSRYAYVMPHPELVKDSSGNVVDVKLEWYNSLLEQGKAWRKLSSKK